MLTCVHTSLSCCLAAGLQGPMVKALANVLWDFVSLPQPALTSFFSLSLKSYWLFKCFLSTHQLHWGENWLLFSVFPRFLFTETLKVLHPLHTRHTCCTPAFPCRLLSWMSSSYLKEVSLKVELKAFRFPQGKRKKERWVLITEKVIYSDNIL